MSEKTKKAEPSPQKMSREERLKQKLRDNLQKRKAQKRSRTAQSVVETELDKGQ